MGKTSFETQDGEELTLTVDDRGRVTLPNLFWECYPPSIVHCEGEFFPVLRFK